MSEITIQDVIRKANEAGYDTYYDRVMEPTPLYGGGMTQRQYLLNGGSWETPWSLPENELEHEYNVFCKIIAGKLDRGETWGTEKIITPEDETNYLVPRRPPKPFWERNED